jgi:hypothetical protein
VGIVGARVLKSFGRGLGELILGRHLVARNSDGKTTTVGR